MLREKYSGLYIGMKDCVRSVMCDRNGGVAALGGSCTGCNALNVNKSFRARLTRCPRSGGASSSMPDSSTNNRYLSSTQKDSKLEDRYNE
eukprot:5489045-Prymnesium_polylepis.1